MNTTRVHPERVYHPDQSQNIAGLHDCIREYKHRVEKLERDVKVLNTTIERMGKSLNEYHNENGAWSYELPEETIARYRRIAEQEVK